jgi:nitroreductase
MNSTIDILKNHRSIRKFVDRPLEEGMLNEMIFAGQSASTSSFIQSCSVIRVTEPSARNKFVALSGGQKYIESAAEFLVFCADYTHTVRSTDR